MKTKIILILFSIITLTSCTKVIDELKESITPNKELYEKTDFFVKQLYTTYQSYGITAINTHVEYTSNGKYKIAPIGRLINVRIEDPSTTIKDYEDLKKDLKRYYKNNSRVNNVYICRGGTIMIDCRN